ncbi:hypothetical protein FGIG_03084 [Fasciola gigantica]|uniref:Uncharacterized protein n=1 Tax=Fasciola gigantica TaxID=46835 RepID=A0A504YQG5_FASGI|nr:hypothetical protein FGIG_03084 [Fasciola gigantica]
MPKGGLKYPTSVDQEILFAKGICSINISSFQCSLGWDVNLENDEEIMMEYERRTERIQQVIPSDRLLLFRLGRGWEPLCAFLQVPVPNKPFPWVKTREEFQADWAKLIAKR